MSIETIYTRLTAAGLSHNGACALMGNMQCESAMRANNAQDGMTPYCDEDYTALADHNGLDFTHDAVGYGLCQWTFYTRKAALLAFAKSRGVSVGNEDMQVDFCLKELRDDYSGLLSYLRSDCDLYAATDKICREFERPAINNVDARYNAAVCIEAKVKGQHGAFEPPVEAKPSNGPTYWYDMKLPLLKSGMEHDSVYVLQWLLSNHGLIDMTVIEPGLMDYETVESVKLYQKDNGLVPDGDVGGLTWASLLGV